MLCMITHVYLKGCEELLIFFWFVSSAILWGQMAKKTFILSDQTKNQYGFVVLTSGIVLDRFIKSPVMLYNHENDDDPNDVIGKWENVRIENMQLLAEPLFDETEDFAKKVMAKVDKGFIGGASIWIDFEFENVKLDLPGYEGIPVITKSELMEASIVSIPNNKNAVKLRASGKEIEDNSLALKLSIDNENQKTNIETMKELGLIFAALGLQLTATSTPEHAVAAIDALKLKAEDAGTKLTDALAKLNAEHENKVTALINDAIVSKKLSAEQKDSFTELAKKDFDNTKKIIDTMVAQKTISEQLNAGGKGADEGGANPFDGKSYKELMASSEGSKYLAKLKAENKPAHKALWEKAFPDGTYNG